jgi:hypothetical protein
LPERASISSPGGRVTILDAGAATLELADPAQAESIDAAEVGRRVAGHIRVAFEVDDSAAATATLAAAGATVLAEHHAHAVELVERAAGGARRPAAHFVRGARTGVDTRA